MPKLQILEEKKDCKIIMPARMAFGQEELQAVQELYEHYRRKNADFGYQGDYEKMYADAFVRYMGVDGFADGVCTGTAALFVAIASLQLKPGSHVIVSAIADPGTISAIILNQLNVVVADNAPNCYNMGVEEFKREITDKTKAVIVVHAAGKAAPMDQIMKIAKGKGLLVIEDCSQAHGAKYQGKKVGTFGDVAAFSTMYSKAHSTGGCGGIIFTQDKKRYDLIRACADRGKPFFKENFEEKNPGTFLFPALNLNINEISCAIGLKSLAKLDGVIKRRLAFLKNLKKALDKESRIFRILDLSDDDSPFFQPIWVDLKKINCSKVQIAHAIKEEGVGLNPHYQYVVSQWPWVKNYLGNACECKNAIAYRDQTFNLLLNERYGAKELKIILNAFKRAEQKLSKG